MRRVSTDEDAPVTKAIGNEAAANPILVRDRLITDVRADAEDGTDRPVAVDGVVFGFFFLEKIIDQPVLVPIDRKHAPAAPGISELIGPSGLSGHEREKARGANIG